MTKVFLDTEFVDDSNGLELISLALVAETSAEYYAVFAEADVSRIVSHAWLRANVVPHLPVSTGPGGWHWDTAHPDYRHVKPRAQVAARSGRSWRNCQARRYGPGTRPSTRSCSAACTGR